MDLASPFRARAGAWQDKGGARGVVAHCARAARLCAARSHKVYTRRLPAASAVGTLR